MFFKNMVTGIRLNASSPARWRGWLSVVGVTNDRCDQAERVDELDELVQPIEERIAAAQPLEEPELLNPVVVLWEDTVSQDLLTRVLRSEVFEGILLGYHFAVVRVNFRRTLQDDEDEELLLIRFLFGHSGPLSCVCANRRPNISYFTLFVNVSGYACLNSGMH